MWMREGKHLMPLRAVSKIKLLMGSPIQQSRATSASTY